MQIRPNFGIHSVVSTGFEAGSSTAGEDFANISQILA